MNAIDKMSSEEIARSAHDLNEQTIGKLTVLGHSIASNRAAMDLIKQCCPPGIPPFAFATAIMIGMAVADQWHRNHGSGSIITPATTLIQ